MASGIPRRVRELHEDDTAVELRLQRDIALLRAHLARAVADGIVTPQERAALDGNLRAVEQRAERSSRVHGVALPRRAHSQGSKAAGQGQAKARTTKPVRGRPAGSMAPQSTLRHRRQA